MIELFNIINSKFYAHYYDYLRAFNNVNLGLVEMTVSRSSLTECSTSRASGPGPAFPQWD